MAVNTYLSNMRRYRLGRGAASGQAAIRPGENAAAYLGRLGGTVGIRGGRRYFTPGGPKPGQSAADYLNASPFDFAIRGGRGYATGKPGPAAAPAKKPTYAELMQQRGWQSDARYLNTESQARRDRDAAYTGLTHEESAGGLEYGINFDREDVDIDGDGTPDTQRLTNFRIADDVDVSNPFSRAALLKKSWMTTRRGNTNSMASQGQLYSGALQRQQDHADTEFAGSKDALLKNFGQLAGDWFTRRYGASKGYTDATSAAVDEWITSQLGREPDPPPAALPQAPAAAPAAARRDTQVKRKGGVRYKRHKKPDGSWSSWYRSGN